MMIRQNGKRMFLTACLLTVPLCLFGCGAGAPGSGGLTAGTDGGNTAAGTEAGASLADETEAGAASAEPDAAQEAQNAASGTTSYVTYNTSHRWGYYDWKQEHKYTQEDYDLVLSFKTEGYEEKSVEEFDRGVMDWENEEAYHKTEDALKRIYMTLPRDDANAGFIFGTLSNTWDACEKKHYNTCRLEQDPWHSGTAAFETYGDVYGDQVFMTGAYAYYDFDYRITDEKTLTVGRRDTLLDSVETSLSRTMEQQAEEKLKDEEWMEKELEERLTQCLQELDPAIGWAGHCSLDYDWDAPYDWEPYEEEEDAGREEREETEEIDTFSQAQYEYVLQSLQFDRHQQMSVAEFDRMVNAAFNDGEDDCKLPQAFDNVSQYLQENDPCAAFFRTTVPVSLEEYEARTRSVYTGAPVDPSYSDWISIERKEDVYGDELTVGEIQADFSFTYRIQDADKLTVGERDRFLNAVIAGTAAKLEEAMKGGSAKESAVDERMVEKALREAGKDAGNQLIIFTGCEVEYVDDYR